MSTVEITTVTGDDCLYCGWVTGADYEEHLRGVCPERHELSAREEAMRDLDREDLAQARSEGH